MSEKSLDLNKFIGRQIAGARKAAKITQDELSAKLGFKDRQILSNIEKGIRKVKPEELCILMETLNQSLDYFSDPYQLPADQLFSWRAKTEEDSKNSEPQARGLISSYRRFAQLTGEGLSPLLPRLTLTSKSSYEDAMNIADALSSFLEMENIAGHKRAEEACRKLKIEIFYMNLSDDVSGSSVLLNDFGALFVNRNHPEGRRYFSLAHELFHVLTWDTFRPESFSPEEVENAHKRSEQLANKFASALLLPKAEITERWNQFNGDHLKTWIEDTANELHASPPALFWRLVNLEKLKPDDYPDDLHAPTEPEEKPAVYSPKFMRMMQKVFESGDASVRKVAKTMECTFEDLEEAFASHQLEAPFEL